MSDNGTAIQCGRTPFLSDGGCDRGSVDIRQFDDLPFCDPISPTMPEIPPEIVDDPISVPIPPPCACVNIAYSVNMAYMDGGKFNAGADFAARGDCCEGNYRSNFNLEIPCPVKGGKRDWRINAGVKYGEGEYRARKVYARTRMCEIRPYDVDLDMEIHCPVVGRKGPRKIGVGIGYGRGGGKVERTYGNADPAGCRMSLDDVDMDLEIPCPVRESRSSVITVSVDRWGHREVTRHEYLVARESSCEIEPRDVDLDFAIPCPAGGESYTRSIGVGVRYGSAEGSGEGSAEGSGEGSGEGGRRKAFFRVDADRCLFSAESVDFDLRLPCPVKGTGASRMRLGVAYGSGGPVEASYIEADHANCAINPLDVDMKLEVPCPFSQSGKFKINNKTFMTVDADACTVTPEKNVSIDFNFNVGCQLGGLHFESSGDGMIDLGLSSSSYGDCQKIVRFHPTLKYGMFAWDARRHTMGEGGVYVCWNYIKAKPLKGGTNGRLESGSYYVHVKFGEDGKPTAEVGEGTGGSTDENNIFMRIYDIGSDYKIERDYRTSFVVPCWCP